ncbi:MAG: hypothetical protein ACYCXK_04330 [Candidatus Humimicrobiaceae bacterium]
MKKNIKSHYLIIPAIFFICFSLLSITSCGILDAADIANILNKLNPPDISVNSNGPDESASTRESASDKTQETIIEESTTTTKQEVTTINIDKNIPEYMQSKIIKNIEKTAAAGLDFDFQKISISEDNAAGGIKIYFKNAAAENKLDIIGSYVLVLACNFYTYCDDMIFEDFLMFWNGSEDALII